MDHYKTQGSALFTHSLGFWSFGALDFWSRGVLKPQRMSKLAWVENNA